MQNPTDWNIVIAVANSTGTILAALALIYSMTTFRKSLRVSNYTDIDRNYFDILQIAIKYPFVQSPSALKTQDETERYALYAFIVWNFIESIHDRCLKDKELKETWWPIMKTEAKVHIDWFRSEENRSKFKESFHKFVQEKLIE